MTRPSSGSSKPSPESPGALRLLLIRASAGSGKTFQLSNRYLRLLRFHDPERILASTFTRKAAGEILERILLRLARAASNGKHLEELSQHLGGTPLTQAECLQMLARLTRQLHRVRIGTLDSFFAKLAGSYGLELGLPPGWRILDSTETAQLRDEALELVLHHGVRQDTVQLMHLLDKGQSSRSVTGLMSQTIEQMYDVFLNSPSESWERFPEARFLSTDRQELLLEELLNAPVDGKRLETARTNDAQAFRDMAWDDLASKGLMSRAVSGALYYNKPLPPELTRPYRELAEHVRAELLTPWKSQNLAARQLLSDFHQAFDELKRTARGVQFDDVARRLADGLTDLGDDEASRLDAAVEHLLLDEFQDTSPLQWRVLEGFAQQVCGDPSRTFFCVGDAKQAIYGWRGGEAAIFDAIERQIPGLETMPLNVSFRSSPVIMQIVNRTMQGIIRHDRLDEFAPIAKTWADAFPEHSTSRTALPGFARLLCGPTSKEQDLEDENVPPQDGDEFVAAYVQELQAQAPGASIGVLTRTNASVGRLIFELQRLGIDASEEGGNPLTDSAAVLVVLSLMSFADHPGNSIARFHVAHSPLGRHLSYLSPEDDEGAHRFALAFRERLLREGYGGVIHSFLAPLAPECNRREFRRLMQLATLGEEFDTMSPTLRPGEFVTYVEQQRRDEPTQARVRVMNVHQSKGLEFDIVVLPELDVPLVNASRCRYVAKSSTPGGPPELVALYRDSSVFEFLGGDLVAARSETLGRMFQESLCVLYVAMTRAVHALHMIISPDQKKNFPKTSAGLLHAALAPDASLAPGAVLYELGKERWFETLPEMTQIPEICEQANPELELIFASSQRRRRLPRQTPSGSSHQPMRLEAVLAPRSSGAMQRGSLLHRWLQEIRWLDEGVPDDATLLRIGRRFVEQTDELERHLARFHDALQQPQFAELLSRRSYENPSQLPFLQGAVAKTSAGNEVSLEVHSEKSFLLSHDDGMMVGAVDRIVIIRINGTPVGVDVIDFKSDQIRAGAPDSLAARIDLYRKQMESYRLAVARLWEIPHAQVRVRLAFLDGGLVEEVRPS